MLLPTHQWVVFCIETVTSLICITQLQLIYKNLEKKERVRGCELVFGIPEV